MDATLDTKEGFVEAAINGVSRVAEAILATPAESRIEIIDAVAESYRKTARTFLDEAEIEEWLDDLLSRLRAEVAAKGPAQDTSERHNEAPSVVPASGTEDQ